MHKLERLIKELLAGFYQETKHRYTLDWKLSDRVERGFSSSLSRNMKISIQAAHLIDIAHAISQIAVACKSGFLKEFLGDRYSTFPLKALWVSCNQQVSVSSKMSVFIPSFFKANKSEDAERFCQRVIELGYNAVVLGAIKDEHLERGEMEDFAEFCHILKSYAIKIVVKPEFASDVLTGSIIDAGYYGVLKEELDCFLSTIPSVDYLFWDRDDFNGSNLYEKRVLDYSLRELIALEIHSIEQILPANVSLIYFLPAQDEKVAHQQASWILPLSHDVDESTIIAFSAVGGNYFWDHLEPHPLWEKLREIPRTTSVSLLPIINAGMITQGEGLWPTPPIDLMERYLSRIDAEHFFGIVAMAPTVPKLGSFLDGSLWVAAQSLWHPIPPVLLYEMWFKAHKQYWSYWKLEPILKKTRKIALDLSWLRSLMSGDARISLSSDECKAVADSLFSQIKELQALVDKMAREDVRKEGSLLFSDYFPYFIRDAHRILLLFLKSFNISIPFGFREEESAESFWMAQNERLGGSLGKMMHEPSSGTPGSRMEIIFKENRLF